MRCFYGRTGITQHCLTACSATLKDESISLVCLDFIGTDSSPTTCPMYVSVVLSPDCHELSVVTVHMGSSHALLRLTARGWKCCPAGSASGSDDSCVGTDSGSQKLRRVGSRRLGVAVGEPKGMSQCVAELHGNVKL